MGYRVDANVHVIAPDRQKYPLVEGNVPEWADGSADDLLEHMRPAGIDQAVLVQPGPVYGPDHCYCLDMANRRPDSFAAVGIVDVAEPDAASVFGSLVERGVAVVRFEYGEHEGRVDTSTWLSSPNLEPLWQEAARRQISVGLPHVGMKHLAALRPILERYPAIPVVLRRMIDVPTEDGPPYAAAQELLSLGKLGNVYFTFNNDNIGATRRGKSTREAFFEAFLGAFSASHLMWASFYPSHKAAPPADPYKGIVDHARDELAFLSEEDRDWLLGETARTVFPALRGALQHS